jgi:hypothetical protein
VEAGGEASRRATRRGGGAGVAGLWGGEAG